MVGFIQNLQNSLIGKIYLAFTKFANKYLFSAVVFLLFVKERQQSVPLHNPELSPQSPHTR